ncbi:DegT/DnrJ/EryC1/StrS family aminotransferase [Lacipirellula sp.]|uniref:DegT/DnrJ/EryC1/StrS family aminotransferase n=1 Tax=Lacipirellula sp. TaxID=2691419 RepID=UPI003D12E1E2
MSRRTPHFAEPLHVGRPNIGDRERLLERFIDLLDRRWLTNDGPYLQEFEQRLAEYLGVRHCVAVCNATIGLELAIRALDMTGEVIVPSFTFPATAHALAWLGVTPVFADVDPTTHTLDPAAVERLVTPRTTGILGVHVWGRSCDVAGLDDVAERHGLKVLYDAAHALGCTQRGQMLGNFGDAEVFSFHATKFVNAAEGGAITTNDDDLAARLRRMRAFGLERGEVCDVGTNAKMNELSAAMGLTSLESVDDFIARNRINLAAYERALAGIPGVRLLSPPPFEQSNCQYIVVEVEARDAGQTRDQLVAKLHEENVLAKKYFSPGCHRMEPYRAAHEATGRRLPQTDRLCDRLLQLPTGTAVDESMIASIGTILGNLAIGRRRAA